MDQLLNGGLVDYVLGAEPAPGVFVIGYSEDPVERQYLNYYKMGPGPLYVFYTPYHLCHFEVPFSVARVQLFGDAVAAPVCGPVCDVITIAKRDLAAGEVLDGIGGFSCYGVLENYDVCQKQNLLPMGLNEGCRLIKDIPKDRPITRNDVKLPQSRLCDQLRDEQDAYFNQGI
jgi:predicted homoserine dehydrogenase-like protein